VQIFEGGMVERFPRNKTHLTSKLCHPGQGPGIQSFRNNQPSVQNNRHHFLDNRIIIPKHSANSFIALSLAATGFGAIILRSSLTRLRMTAGRPPATQVLQMRPIPPIIYRCYEKIVER
jgi:hypothetical protein